MGSGRWDSGTWDSYATASYGTSDRSKLRSKGTSSTFTARTIDPDLDPTKVTAGRRESRDGDDNPAATAIMLFTDVTGSMGQSAQEVLSAMDVVCTNLYDRKPVTDPAILTGAVGDAFYDNYPLQVSQFESDIRIAEQTAKLYIEHGGGGNNGESYALPWLFGAYMTSTDCYEKRGQKGYLFTVGDEPLLGAAGNVGDSTVAVSKDQAKRFLDLDIEADMTAEEIYDLASQKWEIVHICVDRGNIHHRKQVEDTFGAILGDRLLWLQDIALLPELVVSTIQVLSGVDKKEVADSWSDATGLVIASALKDIAVRPDGSIGGDVATL
jgi:hypothetical protein